MGLPWVRLDSNIAHNDKIVTLLTQANGHRAFTLYVCALGWSGGQGTDGHVPKAMVTMLHGTSKAAEQLVDNRLWDYADGGWQIRNWAERQELAAVSEAKRESKQRAAAKGNCVKYHGKDCGCWAQP